MPRSLRRIGCISVLLLMLIPASVGSLVYAKETCGDGVCSAFERQAGSCKEDCSSFRGWCGNRVCERNENCRICPLDCGACGGEVEDVEGLPGIVCGDSVCSLTEKCGDCPEDCGICPDAWSGKLLYSFRRAVRMARWYLQKGVLTARKVAVLRDALDAVDAVGDRMHADALRRTDAAQELLSFLNEHDDLHNRLNAVDQHLLTSVASQGEDAGVLNIVSSIRVRRAARSALRKERSAVAKGVTSLLVDGGVQGVSPETAQLIEEGQIAEAIDNLPTPTRSISNLQHELETYRLLFPQEASKRTLGESAQIPVAFAEDADAASPSSATSSFLESIRLLQRMRAFAQDPEASATTIEEQLQYLEHRGDLLAGILGVSEDAVQRDLSMMEKGVGSTSSKNILDAANVAIFIRESENVRAAEAQYTRALGGMYSLIASILPHRKPVENAENIVSVFLSPEEMEFLRQGSIEERREIVQKFFIAQNDGYSVSRALSRLPLSERDLFEERSFAIRTALHSAETLPEFQKVVGEYHVFMQDLRAADMRNWHPFIRFLFPTLSFFIF